MLVCPGIWSSPTVAQKQKSEVDLLYVKRVINYIDPELAELNLD